MGHIRPRNDKKLLKLISIFFICTVDCQVRKENIAVSLTDQKTVLKNKNIGKYLYPLPPGYHMQVLINNSITGSSVQ